jgi:osmoprotectant transport system permease protein
MVAGFSPDFLGRADGLPGLRLAYGLEPDDVRSLLQAVKYEALLSGEVDVIDGYSTDGRIARYGLRVLQDDRGFFPPYDAAPVVTGRLARERPEAVAALSELAGLMDEAFVQALNHRTEVGGESVAVVAADALTAVGLVDVPAATSGSGSTAQSQSNDVPLVPYLWSRRSETIRLTLRHLLLVGLSMAAGITVAVPLGLGLERFERGAESVIRGVGLLQTIPSIALLAFMIPVLGIGVAPAVAALFLYSLFPIVRNTYTGVRDADAVAVEAARALGMTDTQLLVDVRLPLAAPVIMAGVRTASVINVGTATLAAFIGAGGLGDPIVAGLALSDTYMVLSGAIPAALLAFAVDGGLAAVERAVTPQGLR